MIKINKEDVIAALDLLEQTGMEVAWSLSTIENDRHMLTPIGKGCGVQLVSIDINSKTFNLITFEKAISFRDAMERVIDRLRRRIVGETWA